MSYLSAVFTIVFFLIGGVQNALSEGDSAQQQNAGFKNYGPYQLPIPEVANVRLVFKTDLDVLIPEFQSYSRTDPVLLNYMASGSSLSVDYFKKLIEQTGWGHIVPYLYAGAYHFLGRIYYGISSDMVMADGVSLLPKQVLTVGQITICVVSDPDTWQTYISRIGHSSAQAYWDPLRMEAGMYLDRSMFRGAMAQAKWKGRTKTENVARLSTLITRVVIRNLGHELFHAIQQRTPVRSYKIPLLSEGSALFAEHNAFQREEIVRLSKAQMMASRYYVIDQEAANKCLDGMFSNSWGGDYFTVGELHRAYEYVRYRPEFSLTRLLSMGPDEFYSVDGTELMNRYAVALSTFWFLKSANIETLKSWNIFVSEILDKDHMSQKDDEAFIVDLHYRQWIERLASRWWMNPDALSLFVKTKKNHTDCLGALQFLPAWLRAVESAAYLPGNPTSPMYLGDLYWRIQDFDSALEYYTVAKEIPHPERYGEAASRLKSRVADVYEQLGNVETAMNLYKEVSEMPLEHPRYFLVFVRSRLKYEYYRLTEQEGTWMTEGSRTRLNQYILALQSPSNVEKQMQLLDRQDWNGYIQLVTKQYNEVLEQMLQDLTETSESTQ